jgi:hypothetical protein
MVYVKKQPDATKKRHYRRRGKKQTSISKNAAEAALVAEPEWSNNAPRASLQQSRNADGYERGKGIRRMPNEQSMNSRVWESGPDPPFAPYYPDLEK